MAELIVLQHRDDAPAGLLGAFLAARDGLTVRTVRVDRGELRSLDDATTPAPERIVVLGADASAVGAGSRPWVGEEIALLRRAALRGVPILGICFGAQALATALGGGVHRLDRPQIGWSTVTTSDPQALPAGPWLSWHEDAVSPPPRAVVLAHDEVGVQAFGAGPHLAVQFHPEVTPAIVDGWIGAGGRALGERGDVPPDLRASTAEHAPGAARDALRLFARWLAR
ncbi:type 1 glutamine amidotransferase [Paraconexibacter sp.]|uniref:type 1 glutamine amidotransferase n=1 Tax=Paraconexibacter sp. TaxID=2949640 RepID=UPI00356185C4